MPFIYWVWFPGGIFVACRLRSTRPGHGWTRRTWASFPHGSSRVLAPFRPRLRDVIGKMSGSTSGVTRPFERVARFLNRKIPKIPCMHCATRHLYGRSSRSYALLPKWFVACVAVRSLRWLTCSEPNCNMSSTQVIQLLNQSDLLVAGFCNVRLQHTLVSQAPGSGCKAENASCPYPTWGT